MKILAAILLFLAAPAQAANSLTFVTEDYRPVSFIENGELKGAVVDQAREIADDADVDITIQMMPWARAYKRALMDKKTCVIGAAHTPQRDRLFKWVEPVGYAPAASCACPARRNRPRRLRRPATCASACSAAMSQPKC